MTRLGSLFRKSDSEDILEPEPMEALFPKTTYIEPVPTEMVKTPDFGKFFETRSSLQSRSFLIF